MPGGPGKQAASHAHHGVLDRRGGGVGAPVLSHRSELFVFQVGQAWSAGGDSTGGNQVPSLRFACVVGLSNAAPHGLRKGFCEGRGVKVQPFAGAERPSTPYALPGSSCEP